MTHSFVPRFRGAYSDMHCGTHPALTLDRLDAAQHVAVYKAAHVDNVAAVWAKCHQGYSYYPTDVGIRHPRLKGNYFGEMVHLLHKEDLQAYGYFSLGFDGAAVLRHPEYGVRDKSGGLLRAGTGDWEGKLLPRWYWACFVGPYRDYALAQIKEMVEWYDLDGIFIDIPESHHWQGLCYCRYCVEKVRLIYNVDLMTEELDWPQTVDWWWNRIEKEMMRDVRDAVKSVKPDLPMCSNVDSFAVDKEFMDMQDYLFRDASYFDIGFDQGLQLRASGIKYRQAGLSGMPNAYDPIPLDVTRTLVAGILAQGGLPAVYSEAERADGSLEDQHIKRITSVFEEIVPKEPYLLDAEHVKSVAIYFSWDSQIGRGHKQFYIHNDVSHTVYGAMQCFLRAHVPLDVITSYNVTPELLAGYDLVVLPECTHLPDREVDQLRQYVQNGGKLIATGQTSRYRDGTELWASRDNFPLADVFGLDFVTSVEEYRNNLTGAFVKMGTHEMLGDLKGFVARAGEWVAHTRASSGETLATFVKPCLVENSEYWTGWGPVPPGAETDWPAIHYNRYGSGKCVYIGFDMFLCVHKPRSYWWPRDLSLSLLSGLVPVPPIRVEGPDVLKCSFTRQAAHNRLVVHIVNTVCTTMRGTEPIRFASNVAVGPVTIHVDPGRFDVRRARQVFPTERELNVARSGGKISIGLDVNDVHHMIALDM